MASEAMVHDAIDPLSGLIGPSLFRRTIMSSGVPVQSDPKDLESVHNFMKCLELTSPEKLMNDANRIVDGGAELLKSNLASFADNVGVTVPAKGKDKPQERRPGLGLARERAPFSLRTNISQPSVILETSMDIDNLLDPDEYFDAYERMEKAKKEIQKQLGGSVENLSLYKPSNNVRRRRPGILGKSYKYKHRYSSGTLENNEMLMSSQEIIDEDIPSALKDNSQEIIDEDIPSAPKDNSQEIVDDDIPSAPKDPNPDVDLEEVQLAEPKKKMENEFSDILEELLSCNYEDLEGLGALNLLQERLNIKPLDQQNLGMAELLDVGRTSISTLSESYRKPGRSSLVIDSVLKSLSKKPTMEHERVENLIPSPTPPKSPFASISLLKKKILQPNPLSDPFSPVDVDFSEYPNASAAQPNHKLLGQDDARNELDMCNELELHTHVGNTESLVSNMDAQKMMEKTDDLHKQLANENESVQYQHTDSRPIEEPGNDIDRAMNVHENESNTSALEEEARVDTSGRQQADQEQQPEVRQAKLPRRKGVAGEKRIRKAHPTRKSLAEAGTSFDTDGVRKSKRIKMRPLEYWNGERFLYGRVDNSLKLLGVKYISPGKGDENLKVKPFIMVETSEYKELLELAARH